MVVSFLFLDRGLSRLRGAGAWTPGPADFTVPASGVLAVLAQVTALRGRVGPGWVGHAW